MASCSSLSDNYYGNQCKENPYVNGAEVFAVASVPFTIAAGASIGTGIGAAAVGTYAFMRISVCKPRSRNVVSD